MISGWKYIAGSQWRGIQLVTEMCWTK